MMRLHDYWRSGAAYRVRIALELKGLAYEHALHDLRAGEQHDSAYALINPQPLVPAIEVDGQVITQSPAILEWLEETHPLPALLPADPAQRATVRAMAAIVCCDIHPLNNLRVLNTLRNDVHADKPAVRAWIARWITDGFAALETLVARHGGGYAFGNSVTIADCCLVPQVYSARRFEVPLGAFPRIEAVAARCDALPAFQQAHPSAQPGAE